MFNQAKHVTGRHAWQKSASAPPGWVLVYEGYKPKIQGSNRIRGQLFTIMFYCCCCYSGSLMTDNVKGTLIMFKWSSSWVFSHFTLFYSSLTISMWQLCDSGLVVISGLMCWLLNFSLMKILGGSRALFGMFDFWIIFLSPWRNTSDWLKAMLTFHRMRVGYYLSCCCWVCSTK